MWSPTAGLNHCKASQRQREAYSLPPALGAHSTVRWTVPPNELDLTVKKSTVHISKCEISLLIEIKEHILERYDMSVML